MAGPDQKASLHISNDVVTSAIAITPVLYLNTGRKVVLPQVKLAPSGIAVLSINDALTQAHLALTKAVYGYAEVQYSWPWDALCASIKNIDDARSLTFVYTLEPLQKPAPHNQVANLALLQNNILEGFWWKQEPGVTGFIAIANVLSKPATAHIVVSDDVNNPIQSHSVTVPGHGTALVDLSELDTAPTSQGGVRITYDGPTDGLEIHGGLEDPAVGFSTKLPLHFPPVGTAQHAILNHVALDLMNGAADPNMSFPAGTTFTPYSVARNISNQPLTVTPTIWWMVGIVPHSARLASITVAPFQTVNLNAPALISAAGLKDYSGSVNLELEADGQSRALLEAAGSVDQTNNYVFEVIPMIATESVAKTLSYWSTGNGDNTMITLWNPADEPQNLKFVLSFAGGDGQYTVPIHLNGRETRSFNISTILNTASPDADGNVIPPGTHEGRAEIMGANGENEHILIAMDEGVYNVQKATCQNPYCQTCQGAVDSWISANPFSVKTGGTTSLTFTVQYKSGTQYNHTSIATWTSSKTSVATVSTGTVHGVAPGDVTMDAFDGDVADYSYYCYSSNPDSTCPTDYGQEGTAPGQDKTVPTISVSSPGNFIYGEVVPPITATVSGSGSEDPVPTGQLTFTITPPNTTPPTVGLNDAGEAVWDMSNLSGGVLLAPATYTVGGNYLGDDNYQSASSNDRGGSNGSFVISKAQVDSAITNCPAGAVKAGSPVPFTVSVGWLNKPPISDAAEPTGTVTLTATPKAGGSVIHSSPVTLKSFPGVESNANVSITLTAGAWSVTAAYSGDDNYDSDPSTTQCSVTAQ